tara:strand:- start:8 stop:259 length:252 start_codon:yes stop_codon:yes gene_type:complete
MVNVSSILTISTNKTINYTDNIIKQTMKYITILDFSDGKVYQYEIQDDQYVSTESLESFICDKGFNLGNIEWMSHYDKKIYTN